MSGKDPSPSGFEGDEAVFKMLSSRSGNVAACPEKPSPLSRWRIKKFLRHLEAWDGVLRIEDQKLVEPPKPRTEWQKLSASQRIGAVVVLGMASVMGMADVADRAHMTEFTTVEQNVYHGIYNLTEAVLNISPWPNTHTAPLTPRSAGQPDVASFVMRVAGGRA